MSETSGRYTLKYPLTVTFKGTDGDRTEKIAEVTVRRPKAKDLRVVDDHKGQVAQTLALLAKLSGLTIGQVDQIDAEDLGALGEIVEGFMPPGLLTGGTSSAT